MTIFCTPHRGDDLRHVQTFLTPDERAAALIECKRLKAIEQLGTKWLLAKDYDGHYKPELMKKVAAQ